VLHLRDCRTVQPEWTWPSGPEPRTAAAVSAPPCRSRGCPCEVSRTRCPEGPPGVRRWDADVRLAHVQLSRSTSAPSPTAPLPGCHRTRPPQCAARLQDLLPQSAVAGCPWHLWPCPGCGCPDGCGSVRCPDPAAVSTLHPALRSPGDAVRTAGVRPRTPPPPAGVHCYRKRSPGRRPLVGCSQRRYAWPTWRASRWRSCSRT
jgi:hypothetical protein